MNNRIITNENDLYKKDLCRSRIIECKINGFIISINKYRKLLTFIYSVLKYETQLNIIPDIILQKSILTISREKLSNKGYQYYNTLGISIRCADSKKTLREILNIIKQKKDNIELKIQLRTGELIHFAMITRFDYVRI